MLVSGYKVFAYRAGDAVGIHDLRRDRIPEWSLVETIRWALQKGCDNILVTLLDDPVKAEPGFAHHVCRDSTCPGGCD